jgi:hypothetical protein
MFAVNIHSFFTSRGAIMAGMYIVGPNLVPRGEIEGHIDNNSQTLRATKGLHVEVV